MCGIVGFTGKKNISLLSKMSNSLIHRGPDGKGSYSSNDISLAHRRLSVIDLSARASQPMLDKEESVVLVFNGEIYNFLDLKKILIKKGYQFKSQSDTEVIVHAYKQWGIKLVQKLRGCFAFGLWDRRKKTLYLVRDRVGIKPLYYYFKDKKLFFASEIKAILKNKDIKKEIDNDVLGEYLTWQASLGEKTFIKGIKKLMPGTILQFKQGKISLNKYWCLKKDKKLSNLSFNDLQSQAKNLLEESVKMRLVSDVPLGILLSGGLDSSTILALASNSKAKLNTFTVAFDYGKKTFAQTDDDLLCARIMAKKYQTNHQEIFIKAKNLKKLLPKIVYYQDEPLADSGGIATYLLSSEVSKKVKVVLTGEGADELFGGYSWYKLGLNGFSLLSPAWRQKIYFYLTTYSLGLKPKLNKYTSFKKLFKFQDKDFFSQLNRFDIEHILPNSLCMKLDKMTSAWGLEARVPFLDHKLLEFCFSLDKKYKTSLLGSKTILRSIMKNDLPQKIIDRKKHGFILPNLQWMQGELKDWAKEVLLDRGSYSRQFFSLKELNELFDSKILLKELERANLLWRLLIFELWYKIYF